MRAVITSAIALAAVMSSMGCRESKSQEQEQPGGDGGPPIIDAGPPTDANLTPTGRIADAKAAADGPVAIVIESATVTYLKPAVGDEGAGFFVQAAAEGPGLFIAVDPSGLSPAPATGDEVSFEITEMGTASGGLRQAVAIGDVEVLSSGNSLDELVQDLTTAADVVTGLAAYESELIELEATISGDFGFGGNGHRRAAIATTGVPASELLALRIPEALESALTLGAGCSFRLRGVMWYFGETAQPSGWVEADFADIDCGAPAVEVAVAASDTQVIVRFSRPLAEDSVLADGSQFVITPALSISAAVATGDRVQLTTDAQSEGADYSVEVANTVTDVSGVAVDDAANSADFKGFLALASLVINEVNATIAGGCDLIEIRVVADGSVAGMELWSREQSIYMFPEMSVGVNDFIVVHLGNPVTCNTTGAVSETSTPSSAPAAMHPQNFDTAFDVYPESTGGLAATSNVLSLVTPLVAADPVAAIVEAVLLSNGDNNVAGSSEARADDVASVGEWEMVGGGTPAGGFVDADFVTHAVPGYADTGMDSAGNTIQRTSNSDDNDVEDWTTEPAAATWGVVNAGQSAL